MIEFAHETGKSLRESNAMVLVTGASGWLGRALIEMLAACLGAAISERVVLCGSRAGTLALSNGEALPVQPLAQALPSLAGREFYLCHFAFLTKDRVSQMSEREYVTASRVLSTAVADIAASPGAKGVLLASSGAVYDYRSSSDRDGAANLYGMLKAEDEERFTRIAESSGIPLVMPRIFNVSGPYINKYDAYALSSIILDVLNGRSVRLRAERPVYRSYMHVADIHELCLRMLMAGGGLSMFDTRGEEALELGELAARACRVLGREDAPIERPPLSTGEADRYLGDPDAIMKILRDYGYSPLSLDRQIADTAAYLATAAKAQ